MKGHMRIKTGIKSTDPDTFCSAGVTGCNRRASVLYPPSTVQTVLCMEKVDEVYYDRTFAGFDWPAVLATYKSSCLGSTRMVRKPPHH